MRRTLRNTGRTWLTFTIAILIPAICLSRYRGERLDDTLVLFVFVPGVYAIPLLLASLGYAMLLEFTTRFFRAPGGRIAAVLVSSVIPFAMAAIDRQIAAHLREHWQVLLLAALACGVFVDVHNDNRTPAEAHG